MSTVAQPDKKTNEVNQWWHVLALIAGLDAMPTQKYLLTLILRHTHSRKRFAWADQETLAAEMCVDVSTVERAFRWAKRIGAVGVRRVRTGKGKADQFNEYWLDIERLKELQRQAKHPAPATGAPVQQPAPMTGANEREHPAPVPPSTPHLTPEHPAFDHRAPRTSAGEGFEVKQVVSNSGGESSSSASEPKPDDDDSLDSLEKKKIENLYRHHPRFIALCRRIILDRAKCLRKYVRNPEAYFRAALPSLLREPDLRDMFDTCRSLGWNDALALYVAAIRTLSKPPSSAEIETYLTDQLSAYVENCLWDSPDCPWISFHETDKLLAERLWNKCWPFELCDPDMQTRIYAAIDKEFAECLSKPENLYGYRVTKHPSAENYVLDKLRFSKRNEKWMIQRAHLLAMDLN